MSTLFIIIPLLFSFQTFTSLLLVSVATAAPQYAARPVIAAAVSDLAEPSPTPILMLSMMIIPMPTSSRQSPMMALVL